MRSIAVVFIGLVLSACAGMMMGGGSTAPATGQQGSTTTSARTSDAALRDLVRNKIATDPMLARFEIRVFASGGLITLTGEVATYAARESAERLAIGTAGVKGVDNRISVGLAN